MTTSDAICLTVRPEKARLAPGGRLVLLLALENRGSVAEHCLITVRGLRADWYSLDRPSVLLGPDISAFARLTVHPPAAFAAAGRYPIVVYVTSEETPTRGTARDAEVIVDAGGGVSMDVRPAEVAGPRGLLHVTLRNDTGRDESVALTARTDDEARVRVEPMGPIVVPAGGIASALVHVTARHSQGRRSASRGGGHEIEVRGVRAGHDGAGDPLLLRHARLVDGPRAAGLGSPRWCAAIGASALALALLLVGAALLRPGSSHPPRPTAAPVTALPGAAAPGVFPTRNPSFPPAAPHIAARASRRPILTGSGDAAAHHAVPSMASRPIPSPVAVDTRPIPSRTHALALRPVARVTGTPGVAPTAAAVVGAPAGRETRAKPAIVVRPRGVIPSKARAVRSFLTAVATRRPVRRLAPLPHGVRAPSEAPTSPHGRATRIGVKQGPPRPSIRAGTASSPIHPRRVAAHARHVSSKVLAVTHHGPARRSRQRRVVRPVAHRQSHVRPYQTHPRRTRRHAAAGARLAVLRVAWPHGATLRFSRPETLRLTTAPGAVIVVTLRVTLGERGVGGRRIAQVYRYATSARADRFGRASLPLRYAYVPTRPVWGNLVVVSYMRHIVARRGARIVLIYR